MPEKYSVRNYKTTKKDQVSTCNDEIVICPLCKNYGHAVYHLNTEKQTSELVERIKGINHAHFILNKKTKEPEIDKGRNVTCYVDRRMISKKFYTETRLVLKNIKKLPKWLKEYIEGVRDRV